MWEVLSCCPKCKNLETLQFSDGSMIATKKYTQKSNGEVYHDCGSGKPCMLIAIYPPKAVQQRSKLWRD